MSALFASSLAHANSDEGLNIWNSVMGLRRRAGCNFNESITLTINDDGYGKPATKSSADIGGINPYAAAMAVSLSGIADTQRFLTSFWSRSMSFLAYLVP